MILEKGQIYINKNNGDEVKLDAISQAWEEVGYERLEDGHYGMGSINWFKDNFSPLSDYFKQKSALKI